MGTLFLQTIVSSHVKSEHFCILFTLPRSVGLSKQAWNARENCIWAILPNGDALQHTHRPSQFLFKITLNLFCYLPLRITSPSKTCEDCSHLQLNFEKEILKVNGWCPKGKRPLPLKNRLPSIWESLSYIKVMKSRKTRVRQGWMTIFLQTSTRRASTIAFDLPNLMK